jgi:type II secretory pathway pseudopilin PulG
MNTAETRQDEQGFMLLAVIVAIFIVLLTLSVAAPKVAQDLRRENEVEAIHRGNEYVRAIQLYYRKFGRYPASMDTLEKSNNIRFLRQKYVDPITGKSDWKLIRIGEAKTTVKGFFGKPLAGLPGASGGLGSAQSQSSNIGGASTPGGGSPSSPGYGIGSSSSGFGGAGSSSPGSGFGGASSSPGSGFGSSSPSPTLGGSSTGGSGGGSGTGPSPSGTDASGSSGSSSQMGSGISSQSASSFTGGGTPFVGIGIPKDGKSITVLNEQTNYRTWEFVYDPRIEQLKAAAALMGGGSMNSGGGIGGSLPTGNTPGSSPTSSPFGQPGSSPTSSPFGTTPSPSGSPAPSSSGSPTPP